MLLIQSDDNAYILSKSINSLIHAFSLSAVFSGLKERFIDVVSRFIQRIARFMHGKKLERHILLFTENVPWKRLVKSQSLNVLGNFTTFFFPFCLPYQNFIRASKLTVKMNASLGVA